MPSRGVNNEFDYPLGLPWLLFVILAIAAGLEFRKTRALPGVLILALLFWAIWWMGSQQSRWLYPTLTLGWLGTLHIQRKINPTLIFSVLLVSGVLCLLSEKNALWETLKKSSFNIERDQVAVIQRDSASGLLMSKEMLYVNHYADDHFPGDRTWILK